MGRPEQVIDDIKRGALTVIGESNQWGSVIDSQETIVAQGDNTNGVIIRTCTFGNAFSSNKRRSGLLIGGKIVTQFMEGGVGGGPQIYQNLYAKPGKSVQVEALDGTIYYGMSYDIL